MRMRYLVLALLFIAVLSSRVAAQAVVCVVEDQGMARSEEPVSGGVPFRQGAVFDPSTLVVRGASGLPMPTQAHQLGLSWPDGSIRWALVQFQVSLEAGQAARYTIDSLPGASPAAHSRVDVAHQGPNWDVRTGPLRFSISERDFRLPNRLWIDEGGVFDDTHLVVDEGASFDLVADREAMTASDFEALGWEASTLWQFGLADRGTVSFGRIRRGLRYESFLGGPVTVVAEETGPLRAVLRIEGARPKVEGEIGFVARIYAYAGKKYLRIELSIVNFEDAPQARVTGRIPNTKHLREFVYRLRPVRAEKDITFGTDGGRWSGLASDGPAQRQLVRDAWSITTRSGAGERGSRAPGWLSGWDGLHSLTLATKWFWEVYPRGLAYDADRGELRLELRPLEADAPGYPLAAGRSKTYEFVLGCDVDGAEASALARAELRAAPLPAYVISTGASHTMVAHDDPGFTGYRAYMDRAAAVVEATCLLGDVDFGDRPGADESKRWNGYLGATHELFLFALSSASPAAFRRAEAAVWHTMDVDTYHWGPLMGAREDNAGRSADHVCAAAVQGSIKVWNFGEVDYYLLTGKRRALETLTEQLHFLIDENGPCQPWGFVADRPTSLPYMHLAYMYEALGSEAAVEACFPGSFRRVTSAPFRRDSVGYERSVQWMKRMDEMTAYLADAFARGTYRRSSFMVSYASEGFYRFWALTGDERARLAVLSAADLLYRGMEMSTGMPSYASTPSSPEQERIMPAVFRTEAPAARAFQASGIAAWLDYGLPSAAWTVVYGIDAHSERLANSELATFLGCLRLASQDERALGRIRPGLAVAARIAEARTIAERGLALADGTPARCYALLAIDAGRLMIDAGRYDEAVDWLTRWRDGRPRITYGIQPFIDRATALRGGR